MWLDDVPHRFRPAHGYSTPSRSKPNPRSANGHRRRKLRDRLRAIGAPCWICGKPIDYSLGMVVDDRTGKLRPHPMSFVVDEVVPISRGGSPTDMANCRAAHWICNARRGDGTRRKALAAPLPQPFDDEPCRGVG